jgi:S1-C subfamily serine protease
MSAAVKMFVPIGLLSLIGVSACAMQVARSHATDYCQKQGTQALLLDPQYSINPLFESASAMVMCVDAQQIIHTTSAFGVASVDVASSKGVAIFEVTAGSIGAKAGLKPSDVLYEYAGHEIAHSAELQAAVAATATGSAVAIKLQRDKKEITAAAHF